jgi:hypothetical protein
MLRRVSKAETCVGCQKQSPTAQTDYALISTKFGWRLTRKISAEGTLVLEWRCPACWFEYKRSRPEVATEPSEPARTGRRRKWLAAAHPPKQLSGSQRLRRGAGADRGSKANARSGSSQPVA